MSGKTVGVLLVSLSLLVVATTQAEQITGNYDQIGSWDGTDNISIVIYRSDALVNPIPKFQSLTIEDPGPDTQIEVTGLKVKAYERVADAYSPDENIDGFVWWLIPGPMPTPAYVDNRSLAVATGSYTEDLPSGAENAIDLTVPADTPVIVQPGEYYLEMRAPSPGAVEFTFSCTHARDGGQNTYAGGVQAYYHASHNNVTVNPQYDHFFSLEGNFLSSNDPPVADAGDEQTVPYQDDVGGLTEVQLDGSGSSDPDGDDLQYEWAVPDDVILDDATSVSPLGWFPCGPHLLTLTVTDGINDPVCDDVLITVVDEDPPVLVCTTDRIALWPPNHDMVDVDITVVASDNCSDPADLVVMCTVTSSEPDDATGDGSFTGDVDGQDGYAPSSVPVELVYDAADECFYGTVALRAERDGADAGRTYSITCDVVDGEGNLNTATCVVVVPHDKRKKK